MGFLNRHKKAFILIIVTCCIAGVVVTAEYRTRPNFLDDVFGFVVVPLQNFVSGASGWVSGQASSFGNVTALEAENRRLREEADLLAIELTRLRLIEQESHELMDLLSLDAKYPELPKIGARIIARDPSNWFDTFLINRGTQDGLTEDLVVLGGGGLVGRIIKAGTTYSEVLPLINDTSVISVRSLRTGDLGLLRGELSQMKNGLAMINFISLEAEVMENDEFVTSHLGDIYPPGISVGMVTEIRPDPQGLTQYALVRPAANLRDIETVLVVTEKYDRLRLDELADDRTDELSEINEMKDIVNSIENG